MKLLNHLIPLTVGAWIILLSSEVGLAQKTAPSPEENSSLGAEVLLTSLSKPLQDSGLTLESSEPLLPSEPPFLRPSLVRAEGKPGQAVAQAPLRLEATPTPSNSGATPDPASVPSRETSPPPPGRGAVTNQPAPEYLNPSPNPLQFPTRPEEVRVLGLQPITLQQAIELAERNNRDLQVARLTVERSRAAVRQAEADLYPTAGLNVGITRSGSSASQNSQSSLSRLLGINNDDNNVNTTLSGTVELRYDLFTSGQRPAQIRAARQQLRSDELNLEATREQLRLDISNSYYDLQQADETVRINQAAVRNAEISLRDTLAQERAGLGTRFDVLRAQVQLANSRQDLTNSLANQQIQRRTLARRLSIAESISLVTADPVAVAGTWGLPLEDSIVLAYRNRAELEQQLAQRELANQQRLAALANIQPRISLTAQYGASNTFENSDDGFTRNYSVGAQLSWTPWDGGAAVASARQREADVAIAETRFADNRNQIRLDVESSYAQLLSNRENIQTTETAVIQAREALRLARLRFQAGVGTQTDVINAETDLTRSEGNRVNAILGYNRALASLRRAVSNVTTP